MSFPSFSHSLFALLTTLSVSVGLNTQAGQAQTTTIDPLGDLQTQDSGSGIFSNQGGPSQFFDLMHNLQRGNHLKNPQQLNLDRQQNLEDAAADFRKRQLELLNNPPSTTEPTAETTE